MLVSAGDQVQVEQVLGEDANQDHDHNDYNDFWDITQGIPRSSGYGGRFARTVVAPVGQTRCGTQLPIRNCQPRWEMGLFAEAVSGGVRRYGRRLLSRCRWYFPGERVADQS